MEFPTKTRDKFTTTTDVLTSDLPDPKGNKSTAYPAFASMLESAAKASTLVGEEVTTSPVGTKNAKLY